MHIVFQQNNCNFNFVFPYIIYRFNFMGLKYKIYRLRVKMRRVKEKNLDYLDDVQKRAYDITTDIISDKESVLYYDPENGRRGIKNKSVFVQIMKNKIRISNGKSHDDIPIDDRVVESLIDKFNQKMTRRFNAIENQFVSKAKNRLDEIKDEIKNK